MLQRAASNAYSWWWASHIRTKQSKWMEQHLQDFQEKVDAVMKHLVDDGDSFAKRANMYYKARPELINFVEESFRAYRALAERYDHISKELQNANNTIASICPEQVPFMDEDDDDGSPRPTKKVAEAFKPSVNAPKVPKPPKTDLKTVITSATEQFIPKKVVTKPAPKEPIKSGLTKNEALEEIDRHQKQILTLQTVKEYVKSTYDNAVQKYWDTEEEIKKLQDRVSLLHDEFGEGMVIEDDVARRLMTEAALKTCQETLDRLRVKQERSIDETKIERKRVKEMSEKWEALMQRLNYDEVERPQRRARQNVKVGAKDLDKEVEKMDQQKQELQLLQDQIQEKIALAASSCDSINVSEMAEKIDELVNKVISLETSISNQEALVTRLRSETDELQSQIVTLEDDKAGLLDENNDLTNKLREMDDKMQTIQDLEEMVENQNTDLLTHFTEALSDLDHISEVPMVKPDEKDKIPNLSKKNSEPSGDTAEFVGNNVQQENKIDGTSLAKDRETDVTGLVVNVKKDTEIKVPDSLENEAKSGNRSKATETSEKEEAPSSTGGQSTGAQSRFNVFKSHLTSLISLAPGKTKEQVKNPNTGNNDSLARSASSKEVNSSSGSSRSQDAHEVHSQEQATTADDDEPNWRQLYMNGMKDKEKHILDEYTNVLRNYKDAKKSLSELEQKNEEIVFDSSLKLKELKSSNALKDEEIKLLHQKIGLMERSLEENKRKKEEEDISLKLEELKSSNALKDEEINLLHHKLGLMERILEENKNVKKEVEEEDTSLGLEELKSSNVLKDEEIRFLRQKLALKERSLEEIKHLKKEEEDTSLKLEELKSSNALKDEEIKHLLHKLSVMERSLEENGLGRKEEDDDEDDILLKVHQPDSTSATEEKLRRSIDEILEENLGFWLKFSTTFTEIQIFQTTIQDLRDDIKKLKEKGKSDSVRQSMKSEARPTFKHLVEIQAELSVWLEKGASLKEELQHRSSSLCEIQEEITKALKASAEDYDFKFTSYQAAKFQGEVLNMKQENNKVADELQAGLDHVSSLQYEVDKVLSKLSDRYGFQYQRKHKNTETKYSANPSSGVAHRSRSQVPLGAFIFGVKTKKPRHSIFHSISPNMQKKVRAASAAIKGQHL